MVRLWVQGSWVVYSLPIKKLKYSFTIKFSFLISFFANICILSDKALVHLASPLLVLTMCLVLILLNVILYCILGTYARTRVPYSIRVRYNYATHLGVDKVRSQVKSFWELMSYYWFYLLNNCNPFVYLWICVYRWYLIANLNGSTIGWGHTS